MKFLNTTFIIAACAALFSSCSNEAEEVIGNDVKVDMTIGVSTLSSKTRAHISSFDEESEAVGVAWDQTDKVSVFAKGHEEGDIFNFHEYQTPHNNATFNGKSYANAKTYFVLYPAQSEARLTSRGLEFNIPTEQKAVEGTFDPNACIQIGKGDIEHTDQLSTNNVCAYFYFTVGDGCKYVEIKATDENWYLSGTCYSQESDITSGGVHITGFINGKNSVKLNNIPGAGTYFVSFIPTTAMGSGLKVKAGYEVGIKSYEFKSKSNTQFNAANCYDLGNI